MKIKAIKSSRRKVSTWIAGWVDEWTNEGGVQYYSLEQSRSNGMNAFNTATNGTFFFFWKSQGEKTNWQRRAIWTDWLVDTTQRSVEQHDVKLQLDRTCAQPPAVQKLGAESTPSLVAFCLVVDFVDSLAKQNLPFLIAYHLLSVFSIRFNYFTQLLLVF